MTESNGFVGNVFLSDVIVFGDLSNVCYGYFVWGVLLVRSNEMIWMKFGLTLGLRLI